MLNERLSLKVVLYVFLISLFVMVSWMGLQLTVSVQEDQNCSGSVELLIFIKENQLDTITRHFSLLQSWVFRNLVKNLLTLNSNLPSQLLTKPRSQECRSTRYVFLPVTSTFLRYLFRKITTDTSLSSCYTRFSKTPGTNLQL